jgi:outer membrane protein OmpA-like peptidoglycan-associated protein
MRLLATAIFILALTPAARIAADEVGVAPTPARTADPQAGSARGESVRFTDERHYPLHQGGGTAVSSGDLDEYLKKLQERATDRAFLLAFRDVLFELDSAEIGEAGRTDLAGMAEFLRTHPDTIARIIGHADDRGEVRSNERLAEARAAAVRSFLISQQIPEQRLESVSGGPADPAVDKRTSAGRDSNRRVQVLVQKPPTQPPLN